MGQGGAQYEEEEDQTLFPGLYRILCVCRRYRNGYQVLRARGDICSERGSLGRHADKHLRRADAIALGNIHTA